MPFFRLGLLIYFPSLPECGNSYGVELVSKGDDLMTCVEHDTTDKVIAADSRVIPGWPKVSGVHALACGGDSGS